MKLHMACISYQQKRHGPVEHGVAVIKSPGVSSVITIIQKDGTVLCAPDGGSPKLWWYTLNFFMGAVSMWCGDDQ